MQHTQEHDPLEDAIQKMLGLRAEDFSDRPAAAFSEAIKTFGTLDSTVQELRDGVALISAGLDAVTDKGVAIRKTIEGVPGELAGHLRLVREDIDELRDEIDELTGNAFDHAEQLSELVVDARLAFNEAASELRDAKVLIDRQSDLIERQQRQIDALLGVARKNNEARRGWPGFLRAVFG